MKLKDILFYIVLGVVSVGIATSPLFLMAHSAEQKQQEYREKVARQERIKKQRAINLKRKAVVDEQRAAYIARWGTDSVAETDRKVRNFCGLEGYWANAVREKWFYDHCKPEDKHYYWYGNEGGAYNEWHRRGYGPVISLENHDPMLWNHYKSNVEGGGIAPFPYEIVGYTEITINVSIK